MYCLYKFVYVLIFLFFLHLMQVRLRVISTKISFYLSVEKQNETENFYTWCFSLRKAVCIFKVVSRIEACLGKAPELSRLLGALLWYGHLILAHNHHTKYSWLTADTRNNMSNGSWRNYEFKRWKSNWKLAPACYSKRLWFEHLNKQSCF